MVAVHNEALLSGYLIALKLREAVESGAPAIEFPEQTQHLLQKQQQEEPSELLQNDIEKNLRQASQDNTAISREKMRICRVPYYLREGDYKAYAPHIVSVGPYHHGKKGLLGMDRHKWRAFHHVLKRTGHDINLYLGAVKELEKKARACYQGISITSLGINEFVEMMVLDGCFVIEVFRVAAKGWTELGYLRNDPVFAMCGIMHSIRRDMIILENQLPLFILDRLLGLQLGMPNQTGGAAKLALQFFYPLMPTYELLTKSYGSNLKLTLPYTFHPLSDSVDLDCLAVFRRSLLQRGSQQEMKRWLLPFLCIDKTGERAWTPWSEKKEIPTHNRDADERRQQLIHCVTELREAGIKFKKKKTDLFWDIEFKNGILYIPQLLIHDGTRSLLLNLMAFEQCHLDRDHDITAYVVFMDNLINSHQDVGHLHCCGIIKHWLGSDSEVADLFNRLNRGKVFEINDSYLSRLTGEVNRYYENKWNNWRASLRHTYFSNPWAIISLAAAVFLLLLTFAQTFYGIYGYYKPR
ncbi:UPF0481 protein At3g47200-like [Quercus lobata]|uniref:Uncharacterized protein n=1 Tax=Quercus lobata TaxID=97700 RepID=A0A7N2MPI5_QUELO|nr:UPF0481 protein At3g47200-like [Quercus lobata]